MGESAAETGDGGVADSQPAFDEDFLAPLFGALAGRRRRLVLHCLREYQTPIALADLADEIATREHETSISNIPAEEVKRIYMTLYHTHIPKLADANIVEYAQEEDLVTFSPEEDRVEPIVERAPEFQ